MPWRAELRYGPAWTLAAIRVAFWLVIAFTLVWAPLARGTMPTFHAYGPLSDLLFGTFAQWDSAWYVHLADHGYDSRQITAYFPLYPLVVRAVAEVVRSAVVAGVVVSLASAAVAAALIAKIARAAVGEPAARDAVLYTALYPVAFVFTAIYSEGLFLALSAGAFLAAQRRNAVAAGVLGGLAVATRLVGLALLPALVVLLWPRGGRARESARLAPLLLLPAALVAYALYLRHRFGDALVFAHAQESAWNRHVPALGPLGGLWEASVAGWHGALELLRHLPRAQGYPTGYTLLERWGAWNALQLALLLAAIWLTWVAWKRLGAAFGVYSAATLLILLSSPAELVPLAGVPRYLLTDFPLFVALASVTERRPQARGAVVIAFAAVGALAAAAFSRRVWIS